MTTFKIFPLLIACLLSCLFLLECDVTNPTSDSKSIKIQVRGVVLDAETNAPIQNVEVRLEEIGFKSNKLITKVETNQLGEYQFTTTISSDGCGFGLNISASKHGYNEVSYNNIGSSSAVYVRCQGGQQTINFDLQAEWIEMTVIGNVKDKTDQTPISDATVTLELVDWKFEVNKVAEVETDQQGNYDLSYRTTSDNIPVYVYIKALKNSYQKNIHIIDDPATLQALYQGEIQTVNFELEKPVTLIVVQVQGKVVDKSDLSPIPEASVQLEKMNALNNELLVETTTDQLGLYSLSYHVLLDSCPDFFNIKASKSEYTEVNYNNYTNTDTIHVKCQFGLQLIDFELKKSSGL